VTSQLLVFLFCGAAVDEREMVSPLQQTQAVVWNAETKPFIMMQQNFLRVYGGDALGKTTY
jgi:hypothetical protein